jgi:hypothetical protein
MAASLFCGNETVTGVASVAEELAAPEAPVAAVEAPVEVAGLTEGVVVAAFVAFGGPSSARADMHAIANSPATATTPHLRHASYFGLKLCLIRCLRRNCQRLRNHPLAASILAEQRTSVFAAPQLTYHGHRPHKERVSEMEGSYRGVDGRHGANFIYSFVFLYV